MVYAVTGSRPQYVSWMVRLVRRAVRRWPAVIAFLMVLNDAWWGLRLQLRRFSTASGTTHSTLTVDDSVAYIETVVDDYRRYGGLDRFQGTAAEVGSGDSAGVALLLRAGGSEHVSLIDRFESTRDPKQQSLIYEALSQRHPIEQFLNGLAWNDHSLRGIEWHPAEAAEVYFRRAWHAGKRFDLIVSRSVLEHLYDPLDALRSMAGCLAPGARMVHKVDLRDHGMFSEDHDELTFLRFTDRYYARMTSNTGRPNRILLPQYRLLMEELNSQGLHSSFLITQLVGVGEIVPHLPFEELEPAVLRRSVQHVQLATPTFAARFRNMNPVDLAVAGFFLTSVRSQSTQAVVDGDALADVPTL